MYLIFKIEKKEKCRINKYNKINLIINIISKEETGNMIDRETNNYIKELRKENQTTKRVLIEEFDNMLYHFHKLDNGTRRYIESLVIKLEKDEISSKYISIIITTTRENKFKDIKESEVEELYFDLLESLYKKECNYTKINVNYRKNKDIINKLIEIINKINKTKRDKLNEILNIGRYDVAFERLEQVQCNIYATISIINNYIEKKVRKNFNISELKNVRLEKKLNLQLKALVRPYRENKHGEEQDIFR